MLGDFLEYFLEYLPKWTWMLQMFRKGKDIDTIKQRMMFGIIIFLKNTFH